MTFETFLSFVAVTALLVMSPGPNSVLIAKTVPVSGRTAAFANICGFVFAFALHGALSILGISVILLHSAEAFFVVKMLGAAYLFWLGIKALRDAFRTGQGVAVTGSGGGEPTLPRALGEGFLTNALNPKVSMFYLAAFPQFIPAGEGAMLSAALLVAAHATFAVLWFSGMTLFLSRVLLLARGGGFQRWLKGVTGIVFMGFGLKLATLRP